MGIVKQNYCHIDKVVSPTAENKLLTLRLILAVDRANKVVKDIAKGKLCME